MRTVPAFVAPLVLGPAPASRLSGCLVRLGRAVELDLDRVAAVAGEPVAVALADGFQRCRQFWARGATGEFAATRRLVFSDRQSTTKSSKRDLADVHLALVATNGLGPVVELLLDKEVDEAAIATSGAPLAVRLTRDGEHSVLVAHLRPGLLELGGPASAGEIRRIVEIRANHATWRDRKVRRLEQVDVHVDEIWPGDLPALASARTTLSAQRRRDGRRR